MEKNKSNTTIKNVNYSGDSKEGGKRDTSITKSKVNAPKQANRENFPSKLRSNASPVSSEHTHKSSSSATDIDSNFTSGKLKEIQSPQKTLKTNLTLKKKNDLQTVSSDEARSKKPTEVSENKEIPVNHHTSSTEVLAVRKAKATVKDVLEFLSGRPSNAEQLMKNQKGESYLTSSIKNVDTKGNELTTGYLNIFKVSNNRRSADNTEKFNPGFENDLQFLRYHRQLLNDSGNLLVSLYTKWTLFSEENAERLEFLSNSEIIKDTLDNANVLIKKRFRQLNEMLNEFEKQALQFGCKKSRGSINMVKDIASFWKILKGQAEVAENAFKKLDTWKANIWDIRQVAKPAFTPSKTETTKINPKQNNLTHTVVNGDPTPINIVIKTEPDNIKCHRIPQNPNAQSLLGNKKSSTKTIVIRDRRHYIPTAGVKTLTKRTKTASEEYLTNNEKKESRVEVIPYVPKPKRHIKETIKSKTSSKTDYKSILKSSQLSSSSDRIVIFNPYIRIRSYPSESKEFFFDVVTREDPIKHPPKPSNVEESFP